MSFSKEEQKQIAQIGKYHLIDFAIVVNPKYKPAPFHEQIAEELENIEKNGDRDYKVLLIVMPPRHGKSELCSILFPAWYLGRNPDKEIITISYSSELAQDFGGKTRSLINDEAYKLIFNIRLKEDEQAKAKWKTQAGGSYTSTGVGGTITGRGANCFPVGTLITTEQGQMPIEACKYGTRVLSYNHDRNFIEWKKITGNLRRLKKGFIEITTISGRKVKSTNEHPFFIFGKGYAEAQTLKQGEGLGILQRQEVGDFRMHNLPQDFREKMGRIYKKSKNWPNGFLLLKELFGKTSFIQKQQILSDLRKESIKRTEVLFKNLYSETQNLKRYLLWILRDLVQAPFSFEQVLFYGLQKRLSFAGINGQEQSELQTWFRNGQISARISKEKVFNEKRPESGMYNLSYQGEFGHTSSGHESQEQRGFKSHIGLQELPHYSSQICEDTISSITSTEEELEVYDLEVEDNHNFFTNEILVHNCLLFDDPIKNREEAESEVYRNKVWQFFTSTAFTRLEPKGVVIVILTRWHIDDLAGRILENEELKNKCKVIHFPAIKDGKALWPERYDLNVLEGIRGTIGPYDFASLYMGSPILTEKQEFKPEWYKYITEEELEKKSTNKYLTIDTALSKRDQADYCGFCDNEVDKENFWNLRAWRSRLNADELVDNIFTLYRKRKYITIGIEKTAYTDGLKPFLDAEQRKRGVFLPIKELLHKQTNKEVRIRGLIPRYASGSVRHVRGQCVSLEEEQFNFPFGKNDDTLDAVAYQLQIFQEDIGMAEKQEQQFTRNMSRAKLNETK